MYSSTSLHVLGLSSFLFLLQPLVLCLATPERAEGILLSKHMLEARYQSPHLHACSSEGDGSQGCC